MSDKNKTSFKDAANQEHGNLIGEFWSMLKHNKKYWLLPIVLILLLFGLLIVLGGSAAAPFIYTLF